MNEIIHYFSVWGNIYIFQKGLKEKIEPTTHFITHHKVFAMFNCIQELIWVILCSIATVVLIEMSKKIEIDREQLRLDQQYFRIECERLEYDRQNLYRGKVKHDKTKTSLYNSEERLVKMREDLITDIHKLEKDKLEFEKYKETHFPPTSNKEDKLSYIEITERHVNHKPTNSELWIPAIVWDHNSKCYCNLCDK